jgi:predicted transcriptional regulator
VKPSASFYRPPRRYAVALGCEAALASEFVYADGLNLQRDEAVARIGASCRICRAIRATSAPSPSDKAIMVDPSQRDLVPYRIGRVAQVRPSASRSAASRPAFLSARRPPSPRRCR